MFIANFPAITTASDWSDAVQITDSETGEPVDLTGCTIVVSVARRRKSSGNWWFGNRPLLTATTDDGSVTIVDLGIFAVTFPVATRGGVLTPGVYEVGATISQSGEVIQLLLGTISVLDGIVP
jgi:hypothetical protein